MAQTVNRRPFTAEDRVRSQVSQCEIFSDQNEPARSFSPNTPTFHQRSTPIPSLPLPEGQRGEAWENFQKQDSSGNQGASSKSSSDAIYSYDGSKTPEQNRAIVFPWVFDQKFCFVSSPMGTHSVPFTYALLFLPIVVSCLLSDNRPSWLAI